MTFDYFCCYHDTDHFVYIFSYHVYIHAQTAFKNLNFGKNSRTICPRMILAHSAYLFHSGTFKEKLCRGNFFMFPLGLSLGKWLKLILFSIRLLANKCRSSFWMSFLMCPFKIFRSQLSPVPRNTLPFFTFCTTTSEKWPPKSLSRVSLLPVDRHTPSLFSRSWS